MKLDDVITVLTDSGPLIETPCGELRRLRTHAFTNLVSMIYEVKSAAKAAKARAASKARVQYDEAVAVEEPRSTPKRQAAVATGGKALKTGMVLARARLAGATSEIPATRDRQSALLGKGDYRDSEKVGREAAIGTLKTSNMPKLKDAKDRATHKAAMDKWKKVSLKNTVRVESNDGHSSDLHVCYDWCTVCITGEAGLHRCRV